MENIIEKWGWKKIAIGLVGISLIAIVYVIFSFSNIDKVGSAVKTYPSNKSASNNSSIQKPSNFEAQQVPEKGSNVGQNKTFITPFYQISYSESFSPTLYGPQEGILNGVLLKNKNMNTSVEVIVYDGATTSVEKLSQIPISMGYARSNIKVGPFSGISYSGIVQGTKNYEQIVYIEKNGKIIKLQLMQGSESQNMQSEFYSMLQSLQ